MRKRIKKAFAPFVITLALAACGPDQPSKREIKQNLSETLSSETFECPVPKKYESLFKNWRTVSEVKINRVSDSRDYASGEIICRWESKKGYTQYWLPEHNRSLELYLNPDGTIDNMTEGEFDIKDYEEEMKKAIYRKERSSALYNFLDSFKEKMKEEGYQSVEKSEWADVEVRTTPGKRATLTEMFFSIIKEYVTKNEPFEEWIHLKDDYEHRKYNFELVKEDKFGDEIETRYVQFEIKYNQTKKKWNYIKTNLDETWDGKKPWGILLEKSI